MTKGLQRSLSRAPKTGAQARPMTKTTLAVSGLALEVDGATGVGFGSAVAGGLPQGNLLIQGATAYLTFTGPTSASLTDDWEGDYGVGTTPASDGTITAGDVDIIASTAIAAATAEVSPETRGTGATQSMVDNTDGSLEVNINLLVDDADISADDLAFTVDGRIELIYSVLGDD